MSRRSIALLVLFLASTRPAPAQQSASASIAGTVVADDATSRPIGRAVVTLSGGALRPSLVMLTDDAGRFVFDGLPRGSFTLTASKTPYLTMAYGQTTAGRGSGLPISVENGQHLAEMNVKLPRGAVISGRVTDERGQAVRHAPIIVLEYRTVGGERTLWSLGAQSSSTDSAGMYRAYGLPAGDYVIGAYLPGDYLYFPGQGTGPYTPSGGTARTDARQITAAELQWAAQQVQRAGADSARPAAGARVLPDPPPGPTVAYVPAYYPGTADPAAAVTVPVARGEERTGVDFVMPFQATARIEGRVVGADGQNASNVRMESTGIGGGTMGWSSADGNFSLSSLLPGQYRITARSSDSALWATTEVTLAGQDATGLLLALGPSMTLTGRVAFDATTLTVPADLSTVRVSLVPVGGGLTASRMAADGTFKVASISPGHYRFQASVPGVAGAASDGPRWTVKSVMVKGHDAADAPLDVRPNESVSDVIVTFTDRAADLSGTLRDAAGQPMSGYYIAAFSTDSVFWVQGARRLPPPARSGTTGAFRFVGLPPGEYYLAALIQIDQADLSDAAFLRQLMAVAVRVNLGEGEKKVQDLTLRK